jgi:hypothetical protein
MNTRLVIGMAIVFLTVGIWALPARGDESPVDQQQNYYLKCINAEIDNYSCKVGFATSRSKNLQAYGESSARRTAFLTQNRDALVQEMLAQKVSMRPHAVQQYLRKRLSQEAPIKMAMGRP